MKLLLFGVLLSAAAILPSTLAIFVAYQPWYVPNDDIKHVIFPMNIANAPHKSGYYFAQFWKLSGQVNGSYIGLQPRDSGTVHAAFSTFMANSTFNDSNCHDGADYGPGVSCSVDFNGSYAHTYNLDVRNTEGTTWTGTVIDTVTGASVHIGSWTLPGSAVTTLGWPYVGFVEYYMPPIPPCNELPKTSVVFGVPKTDAGMGSLEDPTDKVGACEGKANFKFTKTADNGIDISVGFLAKAINVHSESQPKELEEYGIGNVQTFFSYSI